MSFALVPNLIVIIHPLNSRLQETTDMLVIARRVPEAGRGIRSSSEPTTDEAGDFCGRLLSVQKEASKRERRLIEERMARVARMPRVIGSGAVENPISFKRTAKSYNAWLTVKYRASFAKTKSPTQLYQV